MLGLITDLRAPRLTFPAAALSRARALTFVYLFFPITLYNHKISHTANSMKRLIERYEWLLLGACLRPTDTGCSTESRERLVVLFEIECLNT